MSHPTTPRDGGHRDLNEVPAQGDAHRSKAPTETEEILPLVEETATVHKREVVSGKIRVRTINDAIEEFAKAKLWSEAVEVTRVPIGRVVDVAPSMRTEDDIMIVPVLEEILVVRKQLVLKEELHIRQRVETEAVEVPVTLRKQRAIVEREAPDGSTINEEEIDP